MALFALIIFLILLSIIGYRYIRVIASPTYDLSSMPLNYEIIGSGGSKVVLLHGLTGSKNYWKRDLDSIISTHQLLLIDLLGFGDSPKPNSVYTLEDHLKAVEYIIIKESFNTKNTIVVGHSMGSILAINLMAEHQTWFNGAVVIGLPIYKDKNDFQSFMSTQTFLNRVAAGNLATIVCMLHPIFMNNIFRPDNLPLDVFEDAKKHTWQSFSRSLSELIIDSDLYALTEKLLKRNVVFIHGTDDTSAPFIPAKNFAATINSTFIDIENGDHQLFLKQPDILWNVIKEFSQFNTSKHSALKNKIYNY